jgi:hypothetical protein
MIESGAVFSESSSTGIPRRVHHPVIIEPAAYTPASPAASSRASDAAACPVVGYSRVCVRLEALRVRGVRPTEVPRLGHHRISKRCRRGQVDGS